jgi:hypothetical protein
MTSGTAGGGSGLAFVDCGMSAAVGSLPEGRRRGVAVNGRRIKTIDIHAPLRRAGGAGADGAQARGSAEPAGS